MKADAVKKKKDWIVYILHCSDGSLYTGITNNMTKRFTAHQQGTAAKYTRSRRPVRLLATGAKMERGDAMRLEIKIKRLPPGKKVSTLKKTFPRAGVRKESRLSGKENIKPVVALWQKRLKKIHYDLPVLGSPERSLFRVVVEDSKGQFFLLEQISPKSLQQKERIAATLDFLARKKLARVQPYLAAEQGDFIIKYHNDFWQMANFIKGTDLDRDQYIYEGWRGPVLADFLIELRKKSRKLPTFDSCMVFSLKNYIYKLVREINLYNKDIRDEINDIVCFLEKNFMSAYDKLPVAFCHGDYHPLNVIWSADDIQCVIDWEFTGYKSELYDAANLIGCVGVENPRSLMGDLTGNFIAALKDAKIISKASWVYLVEFIVALRFAWLAEWLRRKDTDMICLEMDYMRLLIDNKTVLQKEWL